MDRDLLGDDLTVGEGLGGIAGVVEEIGDDVRSEIKRGGAVGAGEGIGEATVRRCPSVGLEPAGVVADGAVDARDREASGGGADAGAGGSSGGQAIGCGTDADRWRIG